MPRLSDIGVNPDMTMEDCLDRDLLLHKLERFTSRQYGDGWRITLSECDTPNDQFALGTFSAQICRVCEQLFTLGLNGGGGKITKVSGTAEPAEVTLTEPVTVSFTGERATGYRIS